MLVNMGEGNRTSSDRTDGSGTGEHDRAEDVPRRSGDAQRESTPGSKQGGEENGIEGVSPEVREVVDELSDAELRGLVRYVNAKLTADESDDAESATSDRTDSRAESVEEQPEGVPSKATRVVKEINDNRYYYWQWRDGDSVKSKYDRPADPE